MIHALCILAPEGGFLLRSGVEKSLIRCADRAGALAVLFGPRQVAYAGRFEMAAGRILFTLDQFQFCGTDLPRLVAGLCAICKVVRRATANLFASKPNGPGSLLKRIRPSMPIR